MHFPYHFSILMDDYFKKGKSNQEQNDQAKQVDAQPVNLDNYGTLPPGTKITEIRNRKEGLQEFLNRDDRAKSIDIERLRK